MRWSSALELLPAALDATVEASWLALLYLVLQVVPSGAPAYLGIAQLALGAVAGLLVARRIRSSGIRAVSVLVTAVLAGTVGWALDPAVGATLTHGALGSALGTHAPGWIAALAVARGAAHREVADDDLVVARILGLGLAALPVPWLLAQAAPHYAHGPYVSSAFVATFTFVTSALLALAVNRLRALGAAEGFDWRRNRSWLGLLVGIVAGAAVVGLPAAFVLGVPVQVALEAVLGPFAIVLTAMALVIAFPILAVLETVRSALIHPATPPLTSGSSPAVATAASPSSSAAPVAVIIAATAVLAIVVVVALAWWLGRAWTNRAILEPDGAAEQRQIIVDRAALTMRLPRLGFAERRTSRTPRDAVEAYRDLLGRLARSDERHPDARARGRGPDETPARHAARLRDEGSGRLALDLLAADYELARYGERQLSAGEQRRALSRWHRLVPRIPR